MINLLPQKEKKALLSEEQFRITLVLGTLFLIFLFSLASLLFSLKAYIKNQVSLERERVTQYQKEIEDREAQALKKKISDFNSDLSNSLPFFEEQVFLTNIFEEISPLLPEGSYLTSFFYQKERKEISLLGFAPTRDSLFELKKNFEKEDKIKDLNFPASNWIKSKDIEFNLSFRLADR